MATNKNTQLELFGEAAKRDRVGVKHHFTTEQKTAMVAEYLSGETLAAVASRNGTTATTILRYIRKAGEQSRGGTAMIRKNQKMSPEHREEVVSRYLAGESPATVAEQFGISPATIRSYLATRDLLCIYQRRRPRIYSHNDFAFDEESEARNYWVGFLMADGCVLDRGKKGSSVQISLARADEVHLRSFLQFVGSNHPIGHWLSYTQAHPGRKHPASRVSISSQQMANSLARFGVVPRKTYTAKVVGLEDCPHFWRGCVDGDGCITENGLGYPVIKLVGMGELVYQFRDFVRSRISHSKADVVRRESGILSYSATGVRATALAKLLYGDCSVALPRKLESARKLIESPSPRVPFGRD